MSAEVDRPAVTDTASLPLLEEGEEEAGAVGNADRKSDGTFSSEGASKASRARWAKEHARDKEAAQQAPDRLVWMRVPYNLGKAVAALARAAEKGDVRAASELRAVMREHPLEDHTDLSALDARTQAQVLDRLLAEIAEDEGLPPLSPSVQGEG